MGQLYVAKSVCPDAEPEPFLGYIRVSTWREEKISPELQRTAIEEWARRTGRRIVDWIEDLDVSGRTFHRKIMGAIERIERGEVRGIAVWRYSRFGRDRLGNAVNLARVETVGGRLESATEPVDAETAIGRFQRGMILEFAAFESDRTGEQWKEVHAHRLSLLLPSGGRPRFGYVWHPRRVPGPTAQGGWRIQEERYEPDVGSEAAFVLAHDYVQYIEGTGFKTLAVELNDLGYRTTRGKLWTDDTLLRYMDSGFAAGYLQVRDSCKCPKSKKSSCRHWRRFPGAHEALISDETWQAYRQRREAVRKMPPRERTATYEHTGLVRCILCRGAMTAHPNSRNGMAYWRCVRADSGGDCVGVTATNGDLLKIVRDWLGDVVQGIDNAPATPIAPTRAAGPDTAEIRTRLLADHDRYQTAITRLITDYALHPERYPDQAYDSARRLLEGERDKALAELAKLPEAPEQLPTADEFRPIIVGVLPEWTTFPVPQRNTILRKVVRHILVSPRPSRYETRARVVPVWESRETEWMPALEVAHEASIGLADMPDGIAWSVLDRT